MGKILGLITLVNSADNLNIFCQIISLDLGEDERGESPGDERRNSSSVVVKTKPPDHHRHHLSMDFSSPESKFFKYTALAKELSSTCK